MRLYVLPALGALALTSAAVVLIRVLTAPCERACRATSRGQGVDWTLLHQAERDPELGSDCCDGIPTTLGARPVK